ncbi:hypothetical protein ACUH90_05195 [Dermabacteraceae bacterium P7054]
MSEQSVAVNAATLVELVTALPGVAGIEPGIASTLRTLDARLRSAASELTGGDDSASDRARYGVILDEETVTLEVGLEIAPRAVRETVVDIQRTMAQALGNDGRTVLVKVQSLG